jgi:hypothetical protein
VRPGMSKPSDQEADFKNKNNLECSCRSDLSQFISTTLQLTGQTQRI